jgi:inosine-uridine nucleoside N-ribohydrolase
MKPALFELLLLVLVPLALGEKRLVLIDQDGSGPGGSNQMAMMVLLQSPDAQVLGITIVTGNAWRDEEVRHTLRMLELIKRTDVPVVPGAVFPLVRTQQETRLATPLVGKVTWLGAWGEGPTDLAHQSETKADFSRSHDPYFVPPLSEGSPHTLPLDQDAAHFLLAQVHAHPHQVTICAMGPLTNIALALAIDPHFAELTRGIVLMGGSVNPQTSDPEFSASPRHEFNFWFDPEAAHIVLRAHWPRIDVTTADVSIKAPFTEQIVDQIAPSPNPAARYIADYSQQRYYMWDEFAVCAWLDPSLVTAERQLYMDVDLSHGPSYGDTLTWTAPFKPDTDVQLVRAQIDLDLSKFTAMFVNLMKAPPLK